MYGLKIKHFLESYIILKMKKTRTWIQIHLMPIHIPTYKHSEVIPRYDCFYLNKSSLNSGVSWPFLLIVHSQASLLELQYIHVSVNIVIKIVLVCNKGRLARYNRCILPLIHLRCFLARNSRLVDISKATCGQKKKKTSVARIVILR